MRKTNRDSPRSGGELHVTLDTDHRRDYTDIFIVCSKMLNLEWQTEKK